jgi:hypothetical protein
MPITLTEIDQVITTDDRLVVTLVDDRIISVPLSWYPRLLYGTMAERVNLQISGAGYGIHWPDLDEDIGIEGLLLGKKSMESQASFERWLMSRQSNQIRRN